MARPKFLYKYASLEEPKYFLDTLVNSHIYVGAFNEMNDPMEGIYKSSEMLSSYIKEIFTYNKLMLRFCALATNPYSTLMWAHYGRSNKGYCLELDVREHKDDDNLVKINYSDDIPVVNNGGDDEIKSLLSHKFKEWSYEHEWRYFVQDNWDQPGSNKFWEGVKIKRVLFGTRISDEDFDLYSRIIKKINPQIKVEKVKKNQLLNNEKQNLRQAKSKKQELPKPLQAKRLLK